MDRELKQEFIKPSSEGRTNKCPYCGEMLPSKNKEHVFNASWGGRAASNKLICNDCNGRFAKTIDLAFKPIVDRILNLWGMAPNRNKTIPNIQIKDNFYIGPHNIAYKKGVDFKYQHEGDKYDFMLSANSKSEIKRFVDNGEMESLIGKTLTNTQKTEIKSQLKYSEERDEELSQPMMKLSLDIKDLYRSAMHTTIKAILLYIPSTLTKFDFKKTLDFIYSGNDEFRNFAIQTAEFMPLPIETPTANVINVFFSKKYKKIIGTFNLLNRYRLSFAMADYDGKQDVLVFVSEGFNGNPDLFAFQTIVPHHISPLPLIELTSDCLSDVDIENQLRELFAHIECNDKDKVYKNLIK